MSEIAYLDQDIDDELPPCFGRYKDGCPGGCKWEDECADAATWDYEEEEYGDADVE